MTAPRARDDDRLVEEVAEVVRQAMRERDMCMRGEVCLFAGCSCAVDITVAALTVARAHFAALSRQHGAAIRGRGHIMDSEETTRLFELRERDFVDFAKFIEGKST